MVEQVVIDTSAETAGPSVGEQAAEMHADVQEQNETEGQKWRAAKLGSTEDRDQA